MRRLAAIDAFAFFLTYETVHGDAADGRLGFLLDPGLGLRRAVPVAEQESALLDLFLELVPSVHLADVFGAEREGAVVDALLDVVQQADDPPVQALQGLGDIGVNT